MPSIIEGLMSQLGGDALDGLGAQLGADRGKTQAGVAAALPLLMGALARNAGSPDGAEKLGAALDRDHDGSVLSDMAGFMGRGDTAPGAGILKHVFGGKQARMENGLAKTTGLDAGSSGKLLAMLAPMVLGALGQAKRRGNLNAAQIGDMLGRERQGFESRGGSQQTIVNALLDSDGDGDVDLGDLAKRGGGLLGKLFGKS